MERPSPPIAVAQSPFNPPHALPTTTALSQRIKSQWQRYQSASMQLSIPTNLERPQIAATTIEASDDSEEKRLHHDLTPQSFSQMISIGQFNRGFLITSLDIGKHRHLYIVDQHASDERWRFEQLQSLWMSRNSVRSSNSVFTSISIDCQPIAQPLKLAEYLDACELNAVTFYTVIFEANGFRIENRCDDLYLVAMPNVFSKQFDLGDFRQLCQLLLENPPSSAELEAFSTNCNSVRFQVQKFRNVFASKACRTAIMIGDALDGGAQRTILKHLSECVHPFSCPHGRPSLRFLCSMQL